LSDYIDYITGTHSLYDKYYDDWRLAINSYHSGPEYKDAHYLRAYQVDLNTPSETVNTYETAEDGSYVAKFKAKVEHGMTHNEVSKGQDMLGGSFYGEKIDNTPVYNYVKLIASEYNSILFRNPPQRVTGDQPEMAQFIDDVDGEGSNLAEFMSQVDILATVYGVIHIGCYKPTGSDIPKFKIHTPEDVTNWSYKYDVDGNLKLQDMVIKLEESDIHAVYRVLTPEYIDTIFVGQDEDYMPPVESEFLEQMDASSYRIRQVNELGYIPVTTVYQNVKVHNNIGSTIIFDVAQIQRSIYGDSAEIYSAITYGAHPTLVVDETTDSLNDGQVGAEPGAVIRVQGGLTGDQQNFVYQFASPPLDAISEIRELIDSKINKLTQIAMLRSEDLIRSARSGNQIEVFDDKLAALIRKKATNLENTESRLFDMYFDWTNQQRPEEFKISYNRQYNKRAVEHEVDEMIKLINAYEKYESVFLERPTSIASTVTEFVAEDFATPAEAESRAVELGGTGSHSHTLEDGSVVYMPFKSHSEYELTLEKNNPGVDYEERNSINAPGIKEVMRDKVRMRLEELLNSTSTDNGL
jgi:hypothetical protein